MLKALIDNEISQEEFVRFYDITIVFRRLPKNVYGLAFKKKRNYVVINSNLGEKSRKSTLLHEFAHIELHHLDEVFIKAKVDKIEDEADRYIEFLLDSLR
ncbi:MAG: ImmA/IrrE family metallo-endopeptidase [Bacilli bacterium]|nr:ImmA/IrrE family metallo-endopeptidase [Bacilli bacterium]